MKKHTQLQKRRRIELKELLGQSDYEKVAKRFAGRSIYFPEQPDLTEDRDASPSVILEGEHK